MHSISEPERGFEEPSKPAGETVLITNAEVGQLANSTQVRSCHLLSYHIIISSV